MEEFVEFLLRECEKRNLSFRQASLRAGLDHGAVSRYVNGTRLARRSAKKLAKFFGVLEREMLVMTGHMASDDLPNPSTADEKQLLERFRSLGMEHKRITLALLDFLQSYNQSSKSTTASDRKGLRGQGLP